VAGPLVGGLVGGTASSVVNERPWLSTALTWWSGDALGVLVMASPILLWRYQSSVLRRRPWDVAALLVVAVVLPVATFWANFAPSILILPVLAWAAFRVGMLGASIGGAVAAFLVNIMSTRGEGPFSHQGLSPAQQVVLTQTYLAVIIVVAMLIAQEAAGRVSAVAEREAERRERLRLESLSRLAQELSAALTTEQIGKSLVRQVLNEAGASAISLGLISADGRKLEWVAESGYPGALVEQARRGVDLAERTLATDAIRSATPVAYRDSSSFAVAYPQRAHWWRVGGAEAILTWPLAAGGRPFGVLQMVWSTPQPLNNAQLAYVSAVSTMVSQALVRAKVYTDEHARAAVLHAVAQPVDQVDVVGLEYSALYRPADAAHGLGGDWYSVMALPDSRTYLTVGDVIGHGLPSVQDMAQLRSTGDAYAHQGLPPAQILSELNRFAARQIRGEFATNLVAIFDSAHNSLAYSSAGHLPALLRRAQTGDVVRLSAASGLMIGPFEDSAYVQESVPVQPGDVLMMYTDGLVEHHSGGLMAGIAHLEQVLAAWLPEALLDCEAVAAEMVHAPYEDDICLLVVKFTSAAAN
jgi:integral membrane sensor domain MASE1